MKSDKLDNGSTILRRSNRLNRVKEETLFEDSKPEQAEPMNASLAQLPLDSFFQQCKSDNREKKPCSEENCVRNGDLTRNQLEKENTESPTCNNGSSVLHQENSDYESLRKARILENQVRLASLGLQKTISELRSISSSTKLSKVQVRKYNKVDYNCTTLRRSNRLSQKSPDFTLKETIEEWEEKRPANAPSVSLKSSRHRLSPGSLAWRCTSKSRGSLYDPVFGICCHYCRQKKLCGEEDCRRCSELDIDQPCRGKTDCSFCHSSNGVLCRGCLKVRYGEEMDEVRENKQWMCPHCIEEKQIRPYWICNSSLCLKKRKMVPTGIAIFRAREMGYASVAHLLMDELQKADKGMTRELVH